MADELTVVIGLGQFGETVARTLGARGREVLAIDRSQEKIEDIKDAVARAVRADSTDEAALRALAVHEASTVVVALGEEDFEAALLTVAVLKSMQLPKVVVRATSRVHGKIFELVGATRIVYPEVQMGIQVAHSISGRGVHDYFSLETGHTLVEVEPQPEWVGKTLAQLDLRNRFDVQVLAIKRRTDFVDGYGANRSHQETIDLPKPGEAVQQKDLLVLVGSEKAVSALTGS